MDTAELKNIISECCNDVLFVYNGKNAGITSMVRDYIPTFQVWHGDAVKEYSNIDDLMTDEFFDGMSINQLVDFVEFTFA